MGGGVPSTRQMEGVSQPRLLFSSDSFSTQFPLRKKATELSDDRTETTNQLSGHFPWGGRAAGLPKEPASRSVASPATRSHGKVVCELRIKNKFKKAQFFFLWLKT